MIAETAILSSRLKLTVLRLNILDLGLELHFHLTEQAALKICS